MATGPTRHAHARQPRAAGGRGTGHGGVVDQGIGRAGIHLVGKAAQLEGGAVELAVQAHRAEVALGIGQRHQRGALGLQRSGQRAQQRAAHGGRAAAEVGRGGLRMAHGGVDLVGGAVDGGHGGAAARGSAGLQNPAS
jgi:hypothetical protein